MSMPPDAIRAAAEACAFWERSWKTVDPARFSAYASQTDTTEDEIVSELMARGARQVCDAGCGCGAYALYLARQGFCVSGFDVAEAAVSLAVKTLSENGCPTDGFHAADILESGYADGSFDAVVARDVVDHMPIRRGAAALRELLRITRPGGCVLLTLDATDDDYDSEPHTISPDGDYLYTGGKWDGMTFHPYTPEEIEKLTDGLNAALLQEDWGSFTVILEK